MRAKIVSEASSNWQKDYVVSKKCQQMKNEKKSINPFNQNRINRSDIQKELTFQYDRGKQNNLDIFFEISVQNLFSEDPNTCLYALHDAILSLRLKPNLAEKITEKEITLIQQWCFLENTPIQPLAYNFLSALFKCDRNDILMFFDQNFVSFSIQKLPLLAVIDFFDILFSHSSDFYQQMIEFGFPHILISLTYQTENLPEQLSYVLYLLRYFSGLIELSKDEWLRILNLIEKISPYVSPKEISKIVQFIQSIPNLHVQETIVRSPIYDFLIKNFGSNDFLNVRRDILNYFTILSKSPNISELLISKKIIIFLTNILLDINKYIYKEIDQFQSVDIITNFCAHSNEIIYQILESSFFNWVKMSIEEGSYQQRKLSSRFISMIIIVAHSDNRILDSLSILNPFKDIIDLVEGNDVEMITCSLKSLYHSWKYALQTKDPHPFYRYSLEYFEDDELQNAIHDLFMLKDENINELLQEIGTLYKEYKFEC